jgi:hypothetical protein
MRGETLLTKTTGAGVTVTGIYHVDRSLNTQRVVVTLEDTDTELLEGGNFAHALKRTDAGLETVLGYGTVAVMVAAGS